MKIGENIKELREKYGMTQTELGDCIDESKQTIYKYETGIVENIPLINIEKIAEIFHVSPSALVGWSKPLSETEHDTGELSEISKAARKLSPENRKILLKYMQFTFPEAFE